MTPFSRSLTQEGGSAHNVAGAGQPDVRRRFTTPTGTWLPITADEIELKPIATIPITRYRYRASKTPNPWVPGAA